MKVLNNIDPKFVKCKTITGNVIIKLKCDPIWLKNITINGKIYRYYNQITSLEGCPKKI